MPRTFCIADENPWESVQKRVSSAGLGCSNLHFHKKVLFSGLAFWQRLGNKYKVQNNLSNKNVSVQLKPWVTRYYCDQVAYANNVMVNTCFCPRGLESECLRLMMNILHAYMTLQ